MGALPERDDPTKQRVVPGTLEKLGDTEPNDYEYVQLRQPGDSLTACAWWSAFCSGPSSQLVHKSAFHRHVLDLLHPTEAETFLLQRISTT